MRIIKSDTRPMNKICLNQPNLTQGQRAVSLVLADDLFFFLQGLCVAEMGPNALVLKCTRTHEYF